MFLNLLIIKYMDYGETLEYLFSQLPMYQRIGKAAYKADLDTTLALDEYFGNPHRKFKTIHVAGTNGKGSVSHMLAAVLQKSGYKTGLYTSPHLVDFRERIRIDGVEVSRKYVVEFVEKHRHIFEKLSPSFFEMTVAMAFDYFAVEKVDVAVVETGMGGRLDSTNIVSPLVSVITNISLDHTEFLGPALQDIAREKAGIIKKGIPVVIGEMQEETSDLFIEVAHRQDSEIYFAAKKFSCDHSLITGSLQSFHISRKGKVLYSKLDTDLLGIYQKKNILTVLQTIEILKKRGLPVERKAVRAGLRNTARITGLSGRWQVLATDPLTVCDTGHNAGALSLVIEQIRATPHKKLHMVIGFVNDKDIDVILGSLPAEALYYFARASIPRALDENLLMEKASAAGLRGQSFGSVSEAVKDARETAGAGDLIFIGGSTFVVADVLEIIQPFFSGPFQ